MNALKLIATPTIYVEVGQSSMKVVDGNDGLELSLERLENGRLTPLCAERLTASLRVFLKKHLWRSGLRAVCAIGTRGVSLRRLTLPGHPSDDELQRMLLLQIEREFPLRPEELAWGYCRASAGFRAPGNPSVASDASGQTTEVLVAAVKKDIIEQYDEILRGCALSAVFTLTAAAHGGLCIDASKEFSILDIGRSHSELVYFRDGLPESVRVLPWGGANVTRAIEKTLNIPQADAEKTKLASIDTGNGEPTQLQSIIDREVEQFAGMLPASGVGKRLYLTGGGARLPQLALRLAAAIGNGTVCERIETLNGEGRSAAIVALSQPPRAAVQPPLLLRAGLVEKNVTPPAALKWVILAGMLLLGCFSLRYAEAFLHKPRLTRQLAQVKAYRDTLPRIERELAFFEYLGTNQPAYLEPLFALAGAAPSGTRLESITLNKRGDLALRATMKDPQQVTQLRSTLIESGLFLAVVVEEQTPSSDRQKLSVRLSGQWKPTGRAAEPPGSANTNPGRAARGGAATNPPAKTQTNAPAPKPSPS